MHFESCNKQLYAHNVLVHHNQLIASYHNFCIMGPCFFHKLVFTLGHRQMGIKKMLGLFLCEL